MSNVEFDADKSIEITAKEIQRGYQAAPDWWKDDAYATIEGTVTVNLPEFHVDEVWKANPSLLMADVDKRAIGGVLKKAEKDGLISKQPCASCGKDKTDRSDRVGTNSKLGIIWKSVHYKAPVKAK